MALRRAAVAIQSAQWRSAGADCWLAALPDTASTHSRWQGGVVHWHTHRTIAEMVRVCKADAAIQRLELLRRDALHRALQVVNSTQKHGEEDDGGGGLAEAQDTNNTA